MPKYLIRASYSAEGARGVIAEGGSKRKETVAKVVEALGGTLEALYFAFGDDDLVAIFDLPDNASLAAASMTVSATGLVRTHTTVLLTPEEIDEAAGKSISYRGPGQ